MRGSHALGTGVAMRPYFAAAALALALGCASKIPEAVDLPGDDITKQVKGREIVERAVAIHGGREAWDALGDVTFTMRDAWPGAARVMAPPYPEMPVTARYAYNYGMNKGRMEFPAAPGLIWGHDSLEGWVERDGKRAYEDLAAVTFTVPTMAYFLALPFKFLDPGAKLHYAGKRERAGKPMETVLVTFGEGVGAAQDRYLAYFDPETGYLAYAAFTVKEQGDLPEGAAEYAEWQDAGGLMMAKRIELHAIRPISMHIHTLEFSDLSLRAEVDPKGYEKPDAR